MSDIQWVNDKRVKPSVELDMVNHPPHYKDASGIECIEVSENWSFCLGNALKYLWRNGKKDGEPSVKDLEKAKWYIQREIDRQKRIHSKG